MILMQLFYLSLLRLSSADDDCTFKTTEWNGQIKSPGYPTYKSGLNCKWHITVALGNVIELTFSDFAMSSYVDKNKYETNCSDATDFTEIYDGNTTSSRLLQKLCGWRKRTNLLTTQNNVLIHMKTAEKKHRGFLLEFQGVCNTKMTKRSDVIQSPNYPDLYPRATTCSWVIDFGYGMHVTLQFPKFDIEYQLNCTYDYVTLHQGLNIASPMLGKNYCGLKSPPSITVTGPLTLHFVSDLDTEYTGFVAQYFTKDRNECILGHECHTNAVCENTIGSYTCTCKSSFRGDGRSCEWYKEVNECSIGSHECDEQAFCVDTKDEYNCTCNSGFHGNGFNCSDINECDTDIVELKHQCHQNATCKNYFASYDCTCIDVYVGDGFNCTDRDECALGIDRCHVNAVCANTDGSYTCACKTGFQGDGYKCHDVNECKTKIDNCDENSQCHNTKGSYHCVCNDGYKGNGFHCEDINECELNLHDCHSDAECVNTNGSFYCYCKPGYEGNGTMCYDIDECLTKTHSCHGDAFCTNTKGLYNCTCNSGFQGNGKNCSDIDECTVDRFVCHRDAMCDNTKGSYFCTCNQGFQGDGKTCEDINECQQEIDNCHSNATCTNLNGSFVCTCNRGYQGNGTACVDINECNDDICDQHASCTNTDGSYIYVDECFIETDNCHGNAVCTNTEGSFNCTCIPGYEGDGINCSDIDECARNMHNCHTDATCQNLIGLFNCFCKVGLEGNGTHCKDITECSSNIHNCSQVATCYEMYASYSCVCHTGYTGDGFSCYDVNECSLGGKNTEGETTSFLCSEETDNCYNNATCRNLIGSFNCTCDDGFMGNGTFCDDVNECEEAVHSCHDDATCHNLIGSYSCSCNSGFMGNGTVCEDLNECLLGSDDCHKDANCENTYGRFKCTCLEGLKGNGTYCEDIPECSINSHECNKNATCVEQYASYSCFCNTGYQGNGYNCSDIDECSSNELHICHSNASCRNTDGSYICRCYIGFRGDGFVCDDIDECEEGIHSCHDDATCHNLIGSYSCSCNSGFMGNGTVCEDLNECLLGSDDCHKDANCENTYGRFTCTCLKGLKGNGTYCEDIFECSTGTHKCSQHATCIEEYASYSCNCNTGYQGNGLNCSDINECSTPELNICNNNASCTNTKGSYTCLCNDGYIGDGFACSDVDECTLNNHRCHKDSTCVNTFGSYTCKCLTGFTGNGTDCKDINECMQQFHICDKKKGECINTRGSYTCRCKPGMIGDGIFCSDSLVAYLVIVSVMDGQWNNDMFDKKTEQFQSMSAAIKTEVDAIYVNERGFISSNVTRLGFGSIRATLLLKFEPWRQFLIEKIETSLKRGKINDMNVNPSSFEVIEIGTCTRGCSVNSYCSKNRLNGTSQCVCEDGYTGDGEICMDVNECENNNGGCAQQCVNIEGSFYCQCNPGFVLEVSQRKCQVNKSANIKHSFCAQDFSQGLHWKASIAETTISHKCPNNQIQGSATRYCNKFGVWDDPDLTSCVKPELTQIHGLVSSHNLSSITLSNVNKILKSLRTELHPSMNILYAGDLIRTQDILSSMMVFMKNKIKDKTMSEVETVLEGVGTILSYIICKKNHEAWYGIPQAFKRLNNHVVIIDMVAKIFSDYMIEEMSKNSTTHPEYLKSFNMAFTAEEMDLHINLVEMRRFNETSLVISSTTNQSYSVEYPSNMFQKDVDKLLNDKGLYTSIGCWADYSRHVTQLSLEGTHYLLKDHFLRREDAIHKCGVVAISLGYNVFTIQDGGLCASGPTLHLTYNKDGTANNCAVGKGGLFANSVYEINKFYTGILTTYHKHLGSLMLKLSPKSLLLPSSTQIQTYGELITSKILKYENKSPLDTPAKISFPQTVSNSSDVTCTQLVENNSSLVWSTNRCKTKVLEKMIECNCSRLAHQTLFYNYTKLPAKNDEDDEYVVLSYVSFGISTFCFLATLLTYSCSKMSRISLIFQANITIMTVITEVIFMFGIGSEIDLEKGVCKALTVLFHFFVTALFSWFLAQSWHSYHKLNDIIKQTYTERVYWYLFLGYGYPCVVSMISLGIFYDSYGIQTNVCWVTDTLLVAMLVPPLALLIILNTVILGMVVGVYFSPRSESSFPDEKTFVLEKDEICHVRDDIRASSILLPIVIATWVFAILHMLDKNSFAKYLFLLFNTLQGILYVIGYCLLNRKIMKRQMWSNPSSNYDSSLGSPNFPSLNMSKMRAIKNGTSNSAFETSPRLGKAAAYNGMNFMNMKRSIPSEVMYEMQQQWSRRKEEEEKEEEGIY